ncbi:hypothetical protein M9H77_08168 [Catharanthus roseus]|uniref:Uncharacterized protein n=1 Tax=Catharanthus roseus TaxID=4058 RepID=A0ACC0BXF4_CATRO|nr:hypothetical protein M9H77_08168 [Catharanthus roseus]
MRANIVQSLALPLSPSSILCSSKYKKRPSSPVFASKMDHNPHGKDRKGKIVDDNMIALRMRIQEMKMLEKKDIGFEPPLKNWLEWEKKYYQSSYDYDIVRGIGILQMLLMETRPSILLGGTFLFVLSSFTCLILVLYHLMPC